MFNKRRPNFKFIYDWKLKWKADFVVLKLQDLWYNNRLYQSHYTYTVNEKVKEIEKIEKVIKIVY